MFILIVIMAFIGELVDSSAGMGYGTLLSPILILMGYSPFVAIPAILLTQAFGGLIASFFHHRFKNAIFNIKSLDFKMAILISLLGIIGVLIGSLVITGIPILYVKIYISFIVLIMGTLILLHKTFKFTWTKVVFVSLLSSFNKCVSGGGFGPILTGGQVIAGHNCKNSIGITTLSETPICLMSFVMYCILVLSGSVVGLDWSLIYALGIGSFIAAPMGPCLARKIPARTVRLILGILLLFIGVFGIWKSL